MNDNFGYITNDFLVSGSYYMAIYHMDIEVLPEWWSITFRHKGKPTVFTSDDYDIEAILKIARNSIITAYNAKRYDLKILLAIIKGLTPELIYALSQCIIVNKGYTDDIRIARYTRSGYWSNFNFIDLLDDMKLSLKEHESNSGMAIIESSIPWDRIDLTDEEKLELLHYNNHDVKAQEMVFKRRIEGYFLPKIVLAEMYDINPVEALKNTNASLTAKILKARKLPIELHEDRYYELPYHVADYVTKFVDPAIVETYLTTGMDVVNKKDIKSTYFGNTGKFGKGGIHTILTKNIRVTTNKDSDFKMFLIDVASYYPNLMIEFNFMSRAVKNRTSFPEIYARRVEAKAKKQKALDKALKLILNSTYGAMGLKFNSLFDPNMAWSVTITGQLLLAALSQELYLKTNCKIMQTNTDGITLAIKNEDIDKMRAIVKNWEKLTRLSMDYDEIDTFVQANVNNYACKFTNGKTKVKGILCMQALTCDETAFEVVKYSNWDMRIVHEAVFRYLMYKEPIEDTIRKCTDIKMFISTTKVGTTYLQTYQKIKGEDIKVKKVNRVVAVKSTKLGVIYKFQLRRGRNPGKNKIWKEFKSIYDELFSRYDTHYDGDKESYLEKINYTNTEIYNIMKDHKLLELVEDEIIKEKLLNGVQFKEYNEKVGKISEHSFIMNNDMSTYTWDTWKDRIDFDFYIKTAKEKVKGWLK